MATCRKHNKRADICLSCIREAHAATIRTLTAEITGLKAIAEKKTELLRDAAGALIELQGERDDVLGVGHQMNGMAWAIEDYLANNRDLSTSVNLDTDAVKLAKAIKGALLQATSRYVWLNDWSEIRTLVDAILGKKGEGITLSKKTVKGFADVVNAFAESEYNPDREGAE